MALQLKVEDILASSPCFPSGFEPMIYPNDFIYKLLSKEHLIKAIRYETNNFTLEEAKGMEGGASDRVEATAYSMVIDRKKSYNQFDFLADEEFNKELHFALIDGCVAYNQASDAFKLADKRRTSNDFSCFDLIISCDVTSCFIDGYTLPMDKKNCFTDFSVFHLLILWILLALIFPSLLISTRSVWIGIHYVLLNLSCLFFLPLLYLTLRSKLSRLKKKERRCKFLVQHYKKISVFFF